MTCCSLCSSICFDELPEFPRIIDTSDEWVFDNLWDYGIQLDPATTPPAGYPYHENLGQLAKSAISCDLYALVCQSTNAWLDKLRKARSFDHRPAGVADEDRRRLDPSAQQLWLFKALHLQDDAKGFLVATVRQDMPKEAIILGHDRTCC